MIVTMWSRVYVPSVFTLPLQLTIHFSTAGGTPLTTPTAQSRRGISCPQPVHEEDASVVYGH